MSQTPPFDDDGREEQWSAVEYNHARHRRRAPQEAQPAHHQPFHLQPFHRRRAAAAHARRRRLRLIDLGIGVALALLLLAIAPGLAIVALIALIGLLVCAASLAYRWARARRRHAARPDGELRAPHPNP